MSYAQHNSVVIINISVFHTTEIQQEVKITYIFLNAIKSLHRITET